MALYKSNVTGGGTEVDITNDVTLNTEQFTFVYLKCTQIGNLVNVQGRATPLIDITVNATLMSGLPFPSISSSLDNRVITAGTAISNFDNGNYVHTTCLLQDSGVNILKIYPSRTISQGTNFAFSITYTI